MRDILRIKEEIEKLEIQLSDKQAEQFLKYYELLIEWNSFMNLTAITEYEEVIVKHFVDSLQLVKVLNLKEEYKILDLGTGAGFPGIPLKIVFPNLKITLLDSLNKRVKFLNEVIDELQLDGIETIHGRAEDYGREKAYREQYDICVSRAVANLSTLSEYCIPYVKIGGFFISYKSGKIEEELENSKNAVKLFGGKIERVETFHLTDTEMERSLVVIKKSKETSKLYPRNAGKPSKEPIL
ncbi:MAG: 16S rRNA (guanine(527)-N(7))-methyltransferase RsmG [Acetivibrio sp.]